MKVAIAQLNYTVGDFEGNKSKIIDSICKARDKGADLVVFAEYAISGTPCFDLLHNAPFLEACEDTLHEIAKHCDNISVLVGLPIQNDNRIISAAALIQNKWVVKYIGKQRISSRFDNMGCISMSAGSEHIEIKDNVLEVAIGEDIKDYRKFGGECDMIISMRSQPFFRGIIEQRHNFHRNMAKELGKNVVMVNHIGGQGDFVYDGSSCAYTNDGKLVGLLNNFAEDFFIVDFDNALELEFPVQNRTYNTYRAIKLGLGDYFRKNGFKKACLGLSGGIDSAVVLAMAAEVLGAENVRVLMMPSRFSSDHSVNDSVEMAENLGVKYNIVPIADAYDAVNSSLKETLGDTKFDVTEENMQARLRMIMLMALSNKHGYIVLNTSNKSEAAVGYGTLYGDEIGSIGIIGDLYKIEVYALARFINRERTIIPDNIICKAPSAELRPDQKDSDSLPPYEVLDAILYRFIEEGQEIEEIITAGFDDEIVHRVVELVKNSEYKRRQTPPPLRLSSRPFSSHFIMPLINKFKM